MFRKSATLVICLAAICLGTAEALNCYTCSGSDCVNDALIGQQITCNSGEKCYTQFNGYVPSQRGCSSSATPGCPGNDCEECETDYCNLNSRSTHKCTVCSSVLDEKCVSDPSTLNAEQCGAATLDQPANQCYSRVIGSVTERGCIRSQADLDRCDGSLCEPCVGEKCNVNVFPADRQKCVECSGGAACRTVYCADPSESCVSVRRRDGTVAKSCESALAESDLTICQTNPASCSRCTNNECNKDPVDFSASRSCYLCEGTDCLRSSVEIEECDNVDDVCFSLFEGFNPVRRGCKTDLNREEMLICDDPDDVSCDLCSTDACNLNSREDHQCNYCSSVKDIQCIDSPNSVVRCPAPTTEVREDAQCYTRIIGTVTERGCLGTPATDSECKSSENCQTCSIAVGAACNTAVFPADRIKCVVNSASDQYCPDPKDSCVQILQDGTRSKKCRSSMSEAEKSFCKANSNKCDFCTGNNCNAQDKTFNYLDCVSCTSSTDIRCTGNALAVANVAQCTTCVTIYTGSTAIVRRGCLASLTQEEQQLCSTQSPATSGTSCSTCSTNRCNAAVYPTGRLSCYTCLGGACRSHDSIELQYCPTYQQGDSCIIQMDSYGKLIRLGCKSSLNSDQVSNCNANTNLCKSCTQAGCNKPSEYLPSGSCIQCNGANDPLCNGNANRFDAEPCNDPLNTQCYTRSLTGGSVERGCVSDLDTASKALCTRGSGCDLCSSSNGKCNSALFVDRLVCYTCLGGSCYSHDSITLEKCASNQQGDSCVVQLDSSGKLVRMGCKSSLTASQVSTCNANGDLCKTCTKSECNEPSKHLPSASCVQCSSAHDPECIARANKFDGEPCNDPLNTQCYSRLISNAVTARGCVNDLDSTSKALCASGTDCVVCSSETGKCNFQEYPVGWRRCFQCDSSSDSNCKGAQSGTAPYCATYSNDHQCYTIVQPDGHTVRKCAAVDSTVCAGASQCEVCQSNECNNRESSNISTTTPATPTTAESGSNTGLIVALALVSTALLAVLVALGVRFWRRKHKQSLQ